MGEACFVVRFAGPLVTFQDQGRIGHMKFGVAHSGPMDRVAFAAANAALGNAPDQTVLEISLGGLVLECKAGSLSVAITGGDFSIGHGTTPLNGWKVLTIKEGERLAVRAGEMGSWAYLAFAGQVMAGTWLGHTATHSTSGFGGGQLFAGQQILVENPETKEDREGEIERPKFATVDGPVRVVMGPQDDWFPPASKETFLQTPYALTDGYDRMGVRLCGEPLEISDALAIPSEPIVRGSVQVSGEGTPTILLADHQTTGGYPKIATVISIDTDRLVQKRSRQQIRFQCVTAKEGTELTREYHENLQKYLAEISVPRGTLMQRLMRENLVSGVVLDETSQDG